MPEFLDFTKVKTADFAGGEFDCACGRKHFVKTEKIFLGVNALSMLKSVAGEIAPAGKALYITGGSLNADYAEIIEGTLKSAGYEVLKHETGETPDIKFCGGLLNMPEDIRFIVSFGGKAVTDAAKYYSSVSGLSLIVIMAAPDSDAYLSDISQLYVNGIKENIKSAAPYAVLCDLNIMRKASRSSVASGLGQVCSKLCALTDRYFAKCIDGEYFCPNINGLLTQCIDMCLNAGEALIAANGAGIDVLCEALLRCSLCPQLFGEAKTYSGAENLAGIIETMRAKSGAKTALYGETVFLCQKYILNLYMLFFNKRFTDLLLPADKARHAQMLSKYTGLDYFDALSRMGYDLSVNKQKIRGYKVEEFRADFAGSLMEALRKADTASVIFKRIYEDSGFWINGYLNAGELKTGAALAADLSRDFTILSYMRNLGLFENYLL